MNENKFLKGFFTKKYADSIGDSNFYVAFEDCGFHISKEHFTDELTKQYSKNVQVEQLSHDCDLVVPVCDTIMGHSSSTISDCIELLKDTIKFNDKKFAADIDTMLPLFGNAKNKLTGLFASTASTIDGRNSFYQSNLNPGNFLDDTDTSVWMPYNESWAFPSATPTDAGKLQPKGINTPVWKIRPDLLQNLQVIKKTEVQPETTPSIEVKNVELHPQTFVRARVVNKVALNRFAMASTDAVNTAVSPKSTTMVAQPVTDSACVKRRANNFLMANALLADNTPAVNTENHFSKALISSNLLNRDIMVQRYIVSNDLGKKEDTPVKTSSVNISFQYCIVNILRPWLYKNIFDLNQIWYCASLAEGFFSTGETSADNKGKLPSLPVSMILIKDLSITATFNAGDWENAKNAVALDSLNIAEADFKDLGDNKHMIESKGVQIIGWICEYLPKFPVCSDPNLITT